MQQQQLLVGQGLAVWVLAEDGKSQLLQAKGGWRSCCATPQLLIGDDAWFTSQWQLDAYQLFAACSEAELAAAHCAYE